MIFPPANPRQPASRSQGRRPGNCHFPCRPGLWLALWLACLLAGCRSVSVPPALDLQAPGWRARQGQAIWLPSPRATEIAGDLTVALHPGGDAWVQFGKPSLNLVTARIMTNNWWFTFEPRNWRRAGQGLPPANMIWLQLAGALAGRALGPEWEWQVLPGDRWRLTHRGTGERLEGYLNP